MSISVKELKDIIVSEAKKEIGYKEGRNNYNKFAIEANALWVQYQAWCGTFNVAIYKRAGINLLKIISNPFYVPTIYAEGRAKGIWVDTPYIEAGDLVLYEFNNDSLRDHTGISIGGITTVEGNTSNGQSGSQADGGGVFKRNRSSATKRGALSLRLMAQKYPQAFNNKVPTIKLNIWESSNTIKGLTTAQVKDIQSKLIKAGYNLGSYGADGSYKKATTTAVIAFQKKYKLTADGVAGTNTVAKLNEIVKDSTTIVKPVVKPTNKNVWETSNTIKGLSKAQVKDIQNKLIKAGYSVGSHGADGSYKNDTVNAVKAFQKKHKLTVDGIAGTNTVNKLNAVIKPVSNKNKAPAFPLADKTYYYGSESGGMKSVSGKGLNSKNKGDVVKDSNGRWYSKGLKLWQSQMKSRGWSIDVDGRYGDQTSRVSLQFKKNYKLGNDPRIGPVTWAAAWDIKVS